MTQPLIAVGWNVALEDLSPFIVPPQTAGMPPTRRQNAISGSVIDEAPYVPLVWPLFETEEIYRAQMEQLGLYDPDNPNIEILTAQVSAYFQDRNYNWILRNAIAVAPQIGSDGQQSDMFLKTFTVILKQLRAQA